MSNEVRQAAQTLQEYALGLPEAQEEFPWGECVIKVNNKIFVFFGLMDNPGLLVQVKLPTSADDALNLPFAQAAGYGLGKHGWVKMQFAADDSPPVSLLQKWILESYRAVAPKRLVAQLS